MLCFEGDPCVVAELHPARRSFTHRKSSSFVPASGIADLRDGLREAVSKLLLVCLNNQKKCREGLKIYIIMKSKMIQNVRVAFEI